jgi:hypothetical protein
VEDNARFVNIDGRATERTGEENLTLIRMQLSAALGAGQQIFRQLVFHSLGL